MDLRVPVASALDAFGLAATVVRPSPDVTPIPTSVFWLGTITEATPSGAEIGRSEPRRVLVIPLADVPTVPRGTVITVAEEEGAEQKQWRVDGIDAVEFDSVRVVVLPEPEP